MILGGKYPVPTLEETSQEILEAKLISRCDLNMAFYQIEFHPDSIRTYIVHVTISAAPICPMLIQPVMVFNKATIGNRKV